MKPAILATDPGDETQNWVIFGSQRNLLRYEEGTIDDWETAILDAQQQYAPKAGLMVVIEDYVLYPGMAKLYQPLLTAEKIGMMKYILAREGIPFTLQKAGEMKIISDDYLKVRNLWVKNRHYRAALKHAIIYMKREAA